MNQETQVKQTDVIPIGDTNKQNKSAGSEPVDVVKEPEVVSKPEIEEVVVAEVVVKDALKASVKELMDQINEQNYSEGIGKARGFKSEGKMEMCLDMIEAMIKKGLEIFSSELDVRLAVPYFRLGDVLLQNLEDKNDLFAGGLTTKNEEDGKTDKAGPQEEVPSERELEIQVAWENLEIARVILDKFMQQEGVSEQDISVKEMILADVLKRIGDCEILKENFAAAIQEIQKTIDILDKRPDKDCNRKLSETYYLMGCVIGYEAKPNAAAESKTMLQKALKIMGKISETIAETEVVSKKEIRATMNMILEKIKDLEEEIKEVPKNDVELIKATVTTNGFNTCKTFAKSQLGSTNVNKLGTFGKGTSKGQEISSKKLQEPASNNLLGTEKCDLNKVEKKVQCAETEKATESKVLTSK